MKAFVAALILLVMFSVAFAQDASVGGESAAVADTPVSDVSGAAGGSSGGDAASATVTETPQRPVEEKPVTKPVKAAEKPAAKPAEKPTTKTLAKSDPEPVAQTANITDATGSPEFVDVTAADFTARRIPELKLNAVKPRIAAESSASFGVSSADKGFFSISKKTIDYITKGLIAFVLVMVVVILRMRDRKKRRRVFRVKNR